MDDDMEIEDEGYISSRSNGNTTPTKGIRLAPYAQETFSHEGGRVYVVDLITRLHRFLCLGTEEGTYYTGEKEFKKENAACIDRLVIQGKGKEVVDIIVDFSVSGRACKQFPILFALALCCRSNDPTVKSYAYQALSKVCRIPTHLFQFIKFCEEVSSGGSGWGRAHRRAIANWYNAYKDIKGLDNPADGVLKLALHVTKYKARHNWSHKDVLRLAHVKSKDIPTLFILRYITKGLKKAEEFYKDQIQGQQNKSLNKVVEFLEAAEKAAQSTDEEEVKSLILMYQLVREHVPTKLLHSKVIWKALIRQMPMTAMIRNLGKMSGIGVLEPGSFEYDLTLNKLRDMVMLKRARVHPFTLLVALNQYKQGHGALGKLVWKADEPICQALEEAFYKSFAYLESTNKRFLLAVDVSGSMNTPVLGTTSITVRDAAAAMMMVTARTEEKFEIVAFSDRLLELDIKREDDLPTVIKKTSSLPFGGTDCSLPIRKAIDSRKPVDVFIIYTDSETYFGGAHPATLLQKYRELMGIPAKLIVCGMASNGFTLANPEDPGMMDVVGFDTNAPQAMMNFVKGII